MSFFDELKQPAPRREEPVLTPEEAAEAEVRRQLADPEVQRVAAEMARTIRSACLEARDRGERRIYGLVTGFRDSRSDFDGYDLPVSYFARFTPWEGGRPVWERRDTCDPPGAKPGLFLYSEWAEQQALLRLLAAALREDGFPEGCVSPFDQRVLYFFPAPRWSRERFGDFAGGVTDYLIQADIRW